MNVGEVLKQPISEKVMEKGGLFIALMAVLYIGYNIYETSSEKERDLILSSLASISQQQLSIQETVKDINKNIYESRVKSDLVVSKIENLERVMNRFVYYNKEQNLLVVKTPDGDLINIRTQTEEVR